MRYSVLRKPVCRLPRELLSGAQISDSATFLSPQELPDQSSDQSLSCAGRQLYCNVFLRVEVAIPALKNLRLVPPDGVWLVFCSCLLSFLLLWVFWLAGW